MKFLLIIYIIINGFFIFSQGEEIGPMISNPYIETSSNNKSILSIKSNQGTFDSTFYYLPDTLNLPFFDDFSKNHFQKYTTNYNDPGVTSLEKFRLIDDVTLLPLPATQQFSSQVTYRRTFSIDHLSYSDSYFSPIVIKIGSLSSYPVDYISTNVYAPYYIYDSLGVTNDISDTIWINTPDIVQDSATQFFSNLNDPNYFWLDNFTYHNYRYAVNPWSIGVATFDGLNENGHAYNLGSNSTNYGDYLTSKPLDLSLYTATDSIYLSFLYQSGGFGEMPDATDSLVLEFYSKDSDEWIWTWSATGSSNIDFKIGHIPLKNAMYFKKGFQFRFKNYGHLSGAFDIFNLDYVHLRTFSGQQDTLFKDFAWVYPINTLIKDYTSAPWDHYKNNFNGKMSSNVNLTIRNGSNIAENNSTPGKIYIEYNNLPENSFAITGNSLSSGDLNYFPRTIYSTLHDLSGGYHFDETKPGTKAQFETIGTIASQFPNFNQNDSTFGIQYFGNYYSYDDGSAEAAYGPTGTQSDLAIKFIPYESDSIIGIMTNFVESATDVSNKLFLLSVWSDNNGQPGTLLYQDDIFSPRSPKYTNDINKFYTYYFKDTQKIKVDGTFYIGWRQFDSDRLNIGFDKNIVNNDKTFYSLNGGGLWNNSQIPGSVMIRPIFSTSMDAELNVIEKTINKQNISLYPNPTTGIVNIRCNAPDFSGVDVYNLQGKLILTSFDVDIDLTNYPSGVYLFKTKDANNLIHKVIKY